MAGNLSQYPKSFGNYLVLTLKRFDDEGIMNERECPYPLHLNVTPFLKMDEGQLDITDFKTTTTDNELNDY